MFTPRAMLRRGRHHNLHPHPLSTTSPPFPRPHPQTRTFLTLLPTSTQHLTASRTLPYSIKPLYNIITDITSYPLFLPYLTSARVLTYSAPDATCDGKRWPRTAELRVNWGAGMLEMGFRSRVFCVPERSVEAVAGPHGRRRRMMRRRRIKEVGKGGGGGGGEEVAHYEGFAKEEEEEEEEKKGDYDTGGVFNSLITRWTLRQLPSSPSSHPAASFASTPSARELSLLSEQQEDKRTEVNLDIEVEFANPAYAALSQAAAPKMADIMIDAFENRARSLLVGGKGGRGGGSE